MNMKSSDSSAEIVSLKQEIAVLRGRVERGRSRLQELRSLEAQMPEAKKERIRRAANKAVLLWVIVFVELLLMAILISKW